MESVLVTGGAGYIGSHTVRELTRAGSSPVVVDNLSEGHREAVLEAHLRVGDLADEEFLAEVFDEFDFSAVMHFAARCYVGESVSDPLLYYGQNVGDSVRLLRAMVRRGVKRFILSSTCATYGHPETLPIPESHPRNPANPYGESKYFLERILEQCETAYGVRSVFLRYFNAAGASLDGRIGESHDPETHLIPRTLQVAAGEEETLTINGDDYPTRDGTCIRDYIHVVDLAGAHVLALKWLADGGGSQAFNLGVGRGFSVREIVEMARRVTARPVKVEIGPRRPGDPPQLVADPSKANRLLGWKPEYSDLENILRSAWRWEQNRLY